MFNVAKSCNQEEWKKMVGRIKEKNNNNNDIKK